MSTFLKGARLKVKRADKHITEIELSIDSLKKRLVCGGHVNPNTGNEFIKCDFANIQDRESFEYLPAIIGDAVHNLKCALDHVWFETMSRLVPSRDWSRTKFPVHPTRDDFESALNNLEVSSLAPKFSRLLASEIKPYGGDNGDFAIRTVHELDIRDKHRLLIPIVHYSSIGDIYVKVKQGQRHRGRTWGTTEPLPHFVEFERGIHIEDPGSASFDVMFQYGDAGRETRAVDTLRTYSMHVLRVVELLEKFHE
jgi:hypothetical protein